MGDTNVDQISRNRLRSKRSHPQSEAFKGVGPEMKEMSETDKESLQSTAGTGLGAKASGVEEAPKQMPGEDLLAYGARMRAFREKKRAQSEAFKGTP